MKQLEELWQKFKLWRKWNKIKAGKQTTDLTRTCGYFFPVGLIGYNALEKEHLIKMTSGKLMRAKLLDYTCYHDPYDMIKEANYQYLGYENEKAFKDMTWEEYHAVYYY